MNVGREVALAAALLAAAAAAAAQEPGEPVFRDEVAVDLVTVTVRVLDRRGEPLPELTSEDFSVRYRRRELPVVAAEWIGSRPGGEEPVAAGEDDPEPPESPAAPQLVVFWVQPDLHAVRIKGHLKLLPHLRRMLVALAPADRVAVASFDSHLKLWQDFTRNRELAAMALEDAVRFGNRPPPVEGLPGGLGEHFDQRAARRAATPEDGLRLTAEALGALPGDKSLVFVGWGLGRYGWGGFRMTEAYRAALAALDAARVSVFVLDVTQADFHTLELGLQTVARDTGGSYTRTNLFPSQAVRLAAVLAGHYRLTVDRSSAPEAQPRDLRVRLTSARGRVLAPSD